MQLNAVSTSFQQAKKLIKDISSLFFLATPVLFSNVVDLKGRNPSGAPPAYQTLLHAPLAYETYEQPVWVLILK